MSRTSVEHALKQLSEKEMMDAIANVIKAMFPDTTDRMSALNTIVAETTTDDQNSKAHAAGMAEAAVCKKLKLKWNDSGIHGADAFNDKGEGVELKTTKKVKGSQRVNITYKFPPREKNQTLEAYHDMVKKHFLDSPKYKGGHYWVLMDSHKKNVQFYHYATCVEFCVFIDGFLKTSPKATSVNLGRKVCATCKRCCVLDKFGTPYDAENNKLAVCNA